MPGPQALQGLPLYSYIVVRPAPQGIKYTAPCNMAQKGTCRFPGRCLLISYYRSHFQK